MNRSDMKAVLIVPHTDNVAPREKQTKDFLSLTAHFLFLFLFLFLSTTTVSADDITWTFTGIISSTDLPAVGEVGELIELTFSADENAPNIHSNTSQVFLTTALTNVSAQVNGVTVYDGNSSTTLLRVATEPQIGDLINWRATNDSGTTVLAHFRLPSFVVPSFPGLSDTLQANMITFAGPGDSWLNVCFNPGNNCVQALPMASYNFATLPPVDTDSDGVPDTADNCTLIANSDQRDTNSDGYGNVCDPDMDNNGTVNFGDVALWVPFFNTATTGDADFNGDGQANFGDFAIFPDFFLQPPGPSGVAP